MDTTGDIVGSRRPGMGTKAAIALVLAVVAVLFSIELIYHAKTVSGTGLAVWLPKLEIFTWIAAFSIVGVLGVLNRPVNAVGWLCLAFPLVWAAWSAGDAVLAYEVASPGSLSDPGLLAALVHPLWVPGIGIIGLLLLLFPDGRVPSNRWRPVLWALLGVLALLSVTGLFLPGLVQDRPYVNPLGVEAFEVFDTGFTALALVIALITGIALAALSVVFRYRRAGTVERLQLKWLMAAAIASAVAYAFLFAVEFEIHRVFFLIPIAIGFAMHRHRLYDIDRIISRSVAYAIVVAILALVYSGAVFALRDLLPGDGGLAVAGSTLVVAAIFNPLRKRVQARVDRLFNRSRYDAERVAERFTGGLRNETDIQQIIGGWVGVVSETMQPSSVGIWTRE